VRGSFNVVQAFLPAASDHPYLINVTTGAAILPPIPGFSSYATTKIIGVKLFEYVLAESPHVHVVSVHPGGVMTIWGIRRRMRALRFRRTTVSFSSSLMLPGLDSQRDFLI
jgi:NAD(P)-dependent dehydrogenase (short-subunit alcohol dehydrogenase family)